jgi:hypothetical protein
MPDDMPFRPEFQQGGAVQAPAIQAPQVLQSNPVPGFQRPQIQGVQFNPTQPQQQIQSSFAAPQQAVQIPFAQQYRTPVYRPPSYQEPITFKDYIGAEFGQLQKSETKRFVNDQGEELYIPFVNGKPIYPIPAGYTEFKKEAPKPEPDKPTTPTTRVTEDDSGDDRDSRIKTTRVSKIASDAAGGQKGIKDFFSTGKGAGIAGSVLGMSMLGPIGAIIGGLLGRSLGDNKQELAQQMGAIPGTTAPVGPERDFEKLSQDAYGKSIADTATMLGGTTPTFSYGYNPGFVDVVTGGTFNKAGISVDENGNMSTSNGVPSYANFSDFVNAMSVSADTGYYGGPVSKDEYNNMSDKGKDLYDAYATGLGIPSYGTPDTNVDFENISDDVISNNATYDSLESVINNPNSTIEQIQDAVEKLNNLGIVSEKYGTLGSGKKNNLPNVIKTAYENIEDKTKTTTPTPPTTTPTTPVDKPVTKPEPPTYVDPGLGDDDDRPPTDEETDDRDDDPVDDSTEDESIVGDDPVDDSTEDESIVGDDPVDDSTDDGSDTGGGCVIATHGVSTGGFTAMEKAKAELWCAKTYHGKWYGEAFRKGYRAAGMKHINAGTAPSVYQEFKDFVAYGRGIKKGWKIGFNYYLRTITFFIHGLFIK